MIKQVFHDQKEYYSYNNSPWVSILESISQSYGIKLEKSNNISKSRWKQVKSNLKCNQKSKFKEDLKCPRCQKEMNNEKHLIEQ